MNDVDVSCPTPGLSPETTVAFSGCTGVNDADVSCSTSGLSPETTVAFSGCTGVNDVDVSCSILHPPPPIPPNIPSTPLPSGTPNSSPTSSVAFSGCTDVDNDVPQTSQFHPNTTIPVDEVSHADNTINPVQAFHHKWSDIFTDPGNWPDFSDQCEAFAKDVLETSATVIVGKKNNPALAVLIAPLPDLLLITTVRLDTTRLKRDESRACTEFRRSVLPVKLSVIINHRTLDL